MLCYYKFCALDIKHCDRCRSKGRGMPHIVNETQVKHVYELLRMYGPATAYDFMQQEGGPQNFPLSVLMEINSELRARQQQRAASQSRRAAERSWNSAERRTVSRS